MQLELALEVELAEQRAKSWVVPSLALVGDAGGEPVADIVKDPVGGLVGG
jgi:hypothetical protein